MPRYLVLHCTDYSFRIKNNQLKDVDSWHKDRGFPLSSKGYFCGYHYLITGDKVYQCREDNEIGAHCNQEFDGKNVYPPQSGKALSVNVQSVSVCVGFDGDIEMPTPKMYDLLQKKVWELQDKYEIPNNRVLFHRFFAKNKSCPGSLITDQWLTDLLTRPKPIVENKISTCIVDNEVAKKPSIWDNLFALIRNANS